MWQLLIGVPVILVVAAVLFVVLYFLGFIAFCFMDSERPNRKSFGHYRDEEASDKIMFFVLGAVLGLVAAMVIGFAGAAAYAIGDNILFGG